MARICDHGRCRGRAFCLKRKREAKREIHRETLEVLTDGGQPVEDVEGVGRVDPDSDRYLLAAHGPNGLLEEMKREMELGKVVRIRFIDSDNFDQYDCDHRINDDGEIELIHGLRFEEHPDHFPTTATDGQLLYALEERDYRIIVNPEDPLFEEVTT